MLGGRMIMEKWSFWRQETKGKTKSREWSSLNSFNKGELQNRRLDKEAQSQILSKPNIRVVKSCSKCLKLEAPEMAKKTSA